ncbi:hypothetical protein TH53_12730, partial [Pedobacter lusitanus]
KHIIFKNSTSGKLSSKTEINKMVSEITYKSGICNWVFLQSMISAMIVGPKCLHTKKLINKMSL